MMHLGGAAVPGLPHPVLGAGRTQAAQRQQVSSKASTSKVSACKLEVCSGSRRAQKSCGRCIRAMPGLLQTASLQRQQVALRECSMLHSVLISSAVACDSPAESGPLLHVADPFLAGRGDAVQPEP